MTDFNLGTVRGRVELDASQAERGAARAEKAVGKLSGGMDRFGRSAGGLATAGAGIAGAGAAIAGGFAVAVNSAVSYEKRLSAIKAVTGATDGEMKGLSETALRIGKETSFSANEAALAIEELAKAGIPIADIMNGAADSTVALAAAGEIALPEAATIASNAMNQFGLSAKQMPKVADAIAGAANASAIDVKDFGFALSQAGAVANLAGLPFEDLAVAIAEMGNAGIKGSDAGTSLKTFLMNLIPTTKAQQQAFEDLGITTFEAAKAYEFLKSRGIKPLGKDTDTLTGQLKDYAMELANADSFNTAAQKKFAELGAESGALTNNFYDATGSIRPLAEVQEVLAKALEGQTDAQKQANLEMLFGSDAIRAGAVLAKNGAAGYDKMAQSMGKVTAEGVAQERLNNLAGMWEGLKGSVETSAIEIGQMLIPVLKAVIKFVQGLVDKWNGLSDKTKKIVLIVAAVVAGFLLLVGVILTVAAAIAGMVAIFAAAGGIALPILGIVAAVVAAIVVIIILVVLIIKNWDKIKALTIRVWTAIKDFFIFVWTAIKDFVVGVFTAIRDFFVGLWESIVSIFTTHLNFIKRIWDAAWKTHGIIVNAVFTAIKNFFGTIFNFIKGIFVGFITFIGDRWRAFWEGPFGQLLIAVWELIAAVTQYGISIIQHYIGVGLDFIQNLWKRIWGAISGFVRDQWNRIIGFIRPIVARMREIIRSVLAAIQNHFVTRFNFYRNIITSVWNAIVTRTRDAWNRFMNVIRGPLNIVRNFINTHLTFIRGLVSGIWNSVVNSTRDAWNRVVGVVRDKINGLMDRVRGLKDRIKNIFSTVNTLLYNAGRDIIQGLINGVVDMIGRLTAKLRAITNLIPTEKGPPKKDLVLLEESGENIMAGLINGIVGQIGPLEKELRDITNAMPGMISPAAGVSARTAGFAQGATSGPTFNKNIYQEVKNYNPVAKPESRQIDEDLQMAAALLEV